MLVIKIELWPGGNKTRAREVGRAFIWNCGGDQWHGNYGVQIDRDGPPFEGPMLDTKNRLQPREQARVWAFPRGPDNLWPLIRTALVACHLRRAPSQGISHGAVK